MLCPAGLETVVTAAAATDLGKFQLLAEGPGFVRGMAHASTTDLRAFGCATNVFNVIASCARSDTAREMAELTRAVARHARPGGLPARGTFRLRLHDDGEFATTSTQEGEELQRVIGLWSGFTVSPRGAQIEFWVIRRREQPETILATKLTEGSAPIAAGVLRPEVCAALARVAQVKRADLVLDPFAGSGAIGAACVDAGARRVWLNDPAKDVLRADGIDREHMEHMRLTHMDFRDLEVIDGSVSAIVTDPPWGHHTSLEDIDALYIHLGAAARSWLDPDGLFVLLTGAEPATVDGLVKAGGFDVHRELPVLINGHKARVLRLGAEWKR
jgi:predicted RNA methylase